MNSKPYWKKTHWRMDSPYWVKVFRCSSLESIEWEFIQWPLPICFALAHAHPWTIISNPCPSIMIWNPCPPMPNNIAAMPTQNPWAWAWVWAPSVGLCNMDNSTTLWHWVWTWKDFGVCNKTHSTFTQPTLCWWKGPFKCPLLHRSDMAQSYGLSNITMTDNLW